MKKLLSKLLAVFLLLAVLAGCYPAATDSCVYADDFGDLIYRTSNLEASFDGWVDTEVDVYEGKQLQIRTVGSVDLCTTNFVPTSFAITSSPTENRWQTTPIELQSADELSLMVSGSYSAFPNSSICGGASRYWDAACNSRGGRGLYVHIGDPVSDTWFGDDGRENDPQFFELYDRANNRAGFTRAASPASGRIFLRYRDALADATGSEQWLGGYDDNRGGYNVQATVYKNCAGRYGQYVAAFIGVAPPAVGSFDPLQNSENIINLHDLAFPADDGAKGVFNGLAPTNGRLWLRVIDDPDIDWFRDGFARGNADYSPGDNTGSYVADIVAYQPPDGVFSNVINDVIDPVRLFLQGDRLNGQPGIIEAMFRSLTSDGDYVRGIRALMALAIAFFAITYMLGLSGITQRELLALSIKLGVLIAITSDASWEFFNFFLFSFFIEGTDDLINIFSSQFAAVIEGVSDVSFAGAQTASENSFDVDGGSRDNFAFLNQTIERFFTQQTFAKIMALFVAFPVGPIYALLILGGMFFFLHAVAKAVLIYLFSIIMISLLFFLAPIMVPLVLFNRTRSLFEDYVRQLIAYSLQPIMLFMLISVFNIFIYTTFYTMLSFSVCWDCVWNFDFRISEAVGVPGSWDEFCIIQGYKPWGFGGNLGIAERLSTTPVGLFLALIFLILSNAMLKFVDWVVLVGTTIAGGAGGAALSGLANQTLSTTKSTIHTGFKGGKNAVVAPAKVAKEGVKQAYRGATSESFQDRVDEARKVWNDGKGSLQVKREKERQKRVDSKRKKGKKDK